MSPDPDPQLDAFAVDVRDLLEQSVANLYSHLVTRPTGRAVRLAIESQLEELGSPALSLVDLSSVSVLDYSCADEVVARLLLGSTSAGTRRPEREVFFLFQGLGEHHREPVLEVLRRHELATVARARQGEAFELLGARSPEEEAVWETVEARGRVAGGALEDLLPGIDAGRIAEELAERRLVFRDPLRGEFHALSTLIRNQN